MSARGDFKGRAKPKRYIPPRPRYTAEMRLEECIRIADLIERGLATPTDEIALMAHLAVHARGCALPTSSEVLS